MCWTNFRRVMMTCCAAAVLLAAPSRSRAECALWDWLFGHGQTTYAPPYSPPNVYVPAAGACGCAPAQCAPAQPACQPPAALHAHRHLSHFLPAGAHGGLHAGRRHRSLQRLRGDDLSSDPGLDLSGLAAAVSDLPSRLRPRCPGRRLVRQLRRLRPCGGYSSSCGGCSSCGTAYSGCSSCGTSLWRLLVVQCRGLQRLWHVGRLLVVRIESGAVVRHAVARSQRHESGRRRRYSPSTIPPGARDDRPASRAADGPVPHRTGQDYAPGAHGGPDLAAAAAGPVPSGTFLSGPNLERGQPHHRAAADPEHPARPQRSATEPHAQPRRPENENRTTSRPVLQATYFQLLQSPPASVPAQMISAPVTTRASARGRQRLATRR